MRNKEMDLLKTIGILYVLGVHYYVPKIFYYPALSFLLSLFFFISGYFFKSIDGFRMKLIYCAQKTKELIWPYFLYQLLLAIVCYFLQICLAINLLGTSWDIDLLQYPINLLLKPLFGGSSIVFAGSWFVTDLWLILIVMQFIYNNKSRDKKTDFVYLFCFLLITLVNIKWSYTSPRPTSPQNTFHYLQHSLFKRIFIRTSFNLLFMFCGIIYRAHIEKHQKLLFTGRNFCLAFISICQLDYYYNGNIYYHHFNAEFLSVPIWLPILTSIIGIYIFMFLAKCVSKHIDDNNILLTIGKETYHIMCQHALVYLLLNIITIALFLDKNFQVLSGNVIYKYKPEMNWPIYISCGSLIPTFSAIYMRKFIRKKPTNTTPNTLNFEVDMSSSDLETGAKFDI